MVEKRHTDFKRMVHAHPVGAGENIVRQIGLDIAIEDFVESIIRGGGVKDFQKARLRGFKRL